MPAERGTRVRRLVVAGLLVCMFASQPAPAAEPIATTADVPRAPSAPSRVPETSFWSAIRVGYLGYGGNFYDNEQGRPESTGNFVKHGPVVELDVGVRLAKRFVPYAALEVAFPLVTGHRFHDADVLAYSLFTGLGIRYTAGNIEGLGFLTDISFGMRRISLSGGGQSYSMMSFEVFRLGLGAEYRVSRRSSISSLLTVSSGVMTWTDGSVAFGAGQPDGLSAPRYTHGAEIEAVRSYLVVSWSAAMSFDGAPGL